jgi:uncharacterized membrane protein (UPF0127 family)
MKDMLVSIDIVWLDSQQKVVHIVKEASPELSTSKTFTPSEDARYVIELQAGAIQRSGIKIGDEATFTLGEKN